MEQTTQNLQTWKESGEFFSYQNHAIFYRINKTAPEQPWLLLIHGFPTCSWDWHKVWPALSKKFNLITLDMMGYGFSDKPKAYPYSIMHSADLCETLLVKHEISSCHILCHDYGDTVFQELLARQIDNTLSIHIEKAVMLNGGIFHHLHRPLFTQKLLKSPLGALVSKVSSQFAFNKSFNTIFGPQSQPTKDELDQLWEALTYKNGKAVMHKHIGYIEERKKHNHRWRGAILNTPIPLRMINGVLDPVSGGHVCDYYEQQDPKADIVRLKKIGHYPQIEAPEDVVKHTLDFLSD